MRPRFEKDLSNYRTLAKEELKGFEDTEKDAERFSQVLDWHLEQAAERQSTDALAQKKIYELQKGKQEVMRRLKQNLAAIDNPEEEMSYAEDARPASYNTERGTFVYTMENNTEAEATFGEIVTDIEWGVNYALDKKSVPRRMLKIYALERARHVLREILDQQIIENETAGEISQRLKEIYELHPASVRLGGAEGGFLAETMVKNILRKAIYDYGADVKIIEADVFQDIIQKIDFIIHRNTRNRGVEVTPDANRQDIGIQFTIKKNDSDISQKEDQIQETKRQITPEWHIDDLALVAVPMRRIRKKLERWHADGKPAGGPDKYLARHTVERLFKKLLENILPAENIDTCWREYAGYFDEAPMQSTQN